MANNERLEYELTICELEKQRDPWVAARAKRDRAEGLDATLNWAFEQQNLRMDYLLEELFGRMGKLALDGATNGTPA